MEIVELLNHAKKFKTMKNFTFSSEKTHEIGNLNNDTCKYQNTDKIENILNIEVFKNFRI